MLPALFVHTLCKIVSERPADRALWNISPRCFSNYQKKKPDSGQLFSSLKRCPKMGFALS